MQSTIWCRFLCQAMSQLVEAADAAAGTWLAAACVLQSPCL